MSVLGGAHSIRFGASHIVYDLIFSERKTLAIHVYPDGSVVVDAPLGSQLEEITRRVRRRAHWILRQQRQFKTYAPPRSLPRRYVSGEAYRYLGRQYRLKVIADAVERVQLSRGHLTVSVGQVTDTSCVARLLDHWYHARAKQVFEERLALCFPRLASLGIAYPQLAVRAMKARWGSCSAAGRITLNVRLIQVPKDLIDYVIFHELCHLKIHDHSPAFYALLDRVLPDWRERRQRLNRIELP